ncbi:MAG TPA: adenylate cyclase [Ignavibacteriales bacterium]|nr:adenylate cyclase [Ignavibacteriales bacterium]
MSKEIERKFLVDFDEWLSVKAKEILVRQGYLTDSIKPTIRVRVAGNKGYLTIKGKVSGITRDEFEYEIPYNDSDYMLKNFCDNSIIEKFRSEIDVDGYLWQVDRFIGENEGLIVAEIELQYEEQLIKIPKWITKEVTGDQRYYNSNLARIPFSKW